MTISNHCRSVQLSFFQISVVIVGCAIMSFRTGLVIYNFRRIQADHQFGINSNGTSPTLPACHASSASKCSYPPFIVDSGTCSSFDNDRSVQNQPVACHAHRENMSIASWSRVKSISRRDDDYKAHVEFYEAMVHPSLLIHPNPYRIVIVHDNDHVRGGQILQQVLKHKMVQEVIYMIPTALKTTFLTTDTSDPRVVVVYVDDPIPYFRLSLPIDVIYVDAATYPNVTNLAFVSAVSNALGECGMLVCHTGPAETMRNLPVSFLRSTRNEHETTNRWVSIIDVIHQSAGFQNIVDYNEKKHKIVIGLKCQQSRADWIWNPAVFQIQIANRMIHHVPADKNGDNFNFDGPSMVGYQFPSRTVEEVWCRNKWVVTGIDDYYESGDGTSCTGHGFDPEIINVPLTSFIVNTSIVANGGRGVFTTHKIAKGTTMILDDCVQGLIIPITTLELLETAALTTNVSEFWDVVVNGFVYGYGWSNSFLGGPAQLGGVDTSISTFVNHGCRGSYNVGFQYVYNEMDVMDCDPHKPCISCDHIDSKVYDPNAERQYPMLDCSNFQANRDIEMGEEIVMDYMCMSGTVNIVEDIADLQNLCSGGLGLVTQYEEQALVSH